LLPLPFVAWAGAVEPGERIARSERGVEDVRAQVRAQLRQRLSTCSSSSRRYWRQDMQNWNV
jgi:hypothetical protein